MRLVQNKNLCAHMIKTKQEDKLMIDFDCLILLKVFKKLWRLVKNARYELCKLTKINKATENNYDASARRTIIILYTT